MAARLNNRHQDLVRQKIQAGVIIDRLQKHFNGELDLTDLQLRSAKILLDKSVSNAPTIIGGDEDKPLHMNINSAPKLSKEEWLIAHGLESLLTK